MSYALITLFPFLKHCLDPPYFSTLPISCLFCLSSKKKQKIKMNQTKRPDKTKNTKLKQNWRKAHKTGSHWFLFRLYKFLSFYHSNFWLNIGAYLIKYLCQVVLLICIFLKMFINIQLQFYSKVKFSIILGEYYIHKVHWHQ